jgi:hypothetical protein
VIGGAAEVVGGEAEVVEDTAERVEEIGASTRGVKGTVEDAGEAVVDVRETLDRIDWQLVSKIKTRQRPDSNCGHLVANVV